METKEDQSIITIRSQGIDQANKAFSAFMRLAEQEINKCAKEDPKLFQEASPKKVEELSLQVLKDVSPQTPFRAKEIILNKAQFFPDILAEQYYGVEVKCTTKDHWTSTGSSIIESTRTKDVERIYMLFGKLGGTPEFRCKPYEDCLVNIAVTHSPRYLIDMDIDSSETIFAKMGVRYDDFRTSDKSIEQVRQYYRKRALDAKKQEMPWWIGDNAEEGVTNMLLRTWSSLSKEEKRLFQAYIFLLFPEVLNSKYEGVALWLCTRFSILIYNARDTFSAGGVYKFCNGEPLSYELPHIVGELIHSAAQIKALLNDLPAELLTDIALYREELLGEDPLSAWLKLIDIEMQDLIKNREKSKKENNRLPEDLPYRDWFEKEVDLSISQPKRP